MADMKPGDFAAFPIQASDAQGSLYAEIGLTKREYMATLIMPSLMAGQSFQGAAKDSVTAADALIEALTTKPKAEYA